MKKSSRFFLTSGGLIGRRPVVLLRSLFAAPYRADPRTAGAGTVNRRDQDARKPDRHDPG